MILIGQYDSPFVRRVAIAMRRYEIAYEHRPWGVFSDGERIAELNPLRRVPTLVLDDGEVLVESGAILDALDEQVGEARALLPARGAVRRQGLKVIALATGFADKAVSLFYETFFHPTPSEPWTARLRSQIGDTLDALEDQSRPVYDGLVARGVADARGHRGRVRLVPPARMSPGVPEARALAAARRARGARGRISRSSGRSTSRSSCGPEGTVQPSAARTASPIPAVESGVSPPRSRVRAPLASARSTALSMVRASASSPRLWRSSIAALRIVPSGLRDALAGDVGRRAVDRLVQAELALAERGARQHAERAGEHRGLVRQDVAEHVLGDDHVEAARAR